MKLQGAASSGTVQGHCWKLMGSHCPPRQPHGSEKLERARNLSPFPAVLKGSSSWLVPNAGTGSRDKLQLRTQRAGLRTETRGHGRRGCGQTQGLADGSWLGPVSLGNDHGKEETVKGHDTGLKMQKRPQNQKEGRGDL